MEPIVANKSIRTYWHILAQWGRPGDRLAIGRSLRNHLLESLPPSRRHVVVFLRLLPSRRHVAAFLRWLLSSLPRLLLAKPPPDSAGMSRWPICELLLEIIRMCSTSAFCRVCRGKALVRAALLSLSPKPALASFPVSVGLFAKQMCDQAPGLRRQGTNSSNARPPCALPFLGLPR